MAKYYKITCSLLLIAGLIGGCKKDLPVDEDGLLITQRAECYVGNFELLGTDFVTVRSKTAVIDTTALTINVEVFFGTDLKNVYPQFSLATDCKLDPKIVGKVDLSDLSNPKTYTVISGNRLVKKPYKIIVKYQ
ncbi:MAG: hypothetical protein JWP81_2113 [Ferruginibacter sp.]|nr:hypothetical protein [Ferruginibacter sp.]